MYATLLTELNMAPPPSAATNDNLDLDFLEHYQSDQNDLAVNFLLDDDYASPCIATSELVALHACLFQFVASLN